MKLLTIDTEALRRLLSYDPLTGKLYWKVNRYAYGDRGRLNARAGDVAGCLDKLGYWVIRIDGANHFAHRLAWQHHYGDPPGSVLDHINGIPSDNRLSNLRAASQSENLANSRRSSGNTSGYKGVSWSKSAKKWRASIRVSGKFINIGHFDDPEAAHSAYVAKAKELFSEFSRSG